MNSQREQGPDVARRINHRSVGVLTTFLVSFAMRHLTGIVKLTNNIDEERPGHRTRGVQRYLYEDIAKYGLA